MAKTKPDEVWMPELRLRLPTSWTKGVEMRVQRHLDNLSCPACKAAIDRSWGRPAPWDRPVPGAYNSSLEGMVAATCTECGYVALFVLDTMLEKSPALPGDEE